MNGMELDLAYLCKEVREIARASATFLKEERRKFDRIGTTDHRGFVYFATRGWFYRGGRLWKFDR